MNRVSFVVPALAGRERRSRLKAELQTIDGSWRGRATSRTLLWLVLLCLCLALPRLSAATFTAALDRDTITAGESATLTLTFSGGKPQSNPAVPSVPNLSINYAGQSSQINIINGSYSSSLIYNYVVTAAQPGEFTIPAIRAQVDGATLASQPLKLKVLKDNQAGAGAKFAFLKLLVPKTEVYVGELFPVEIQLYVVSGQDLQQPQFKSDGFVIGKRTEPRQGKVQAGNMIYNVVSFKMSVAAAKVGTLTLGPAECSLTLRIPRANRRSRDPFDSFPSDLFPDFFGRREELRPATLVSEPLTLRVLPLPTQNVPPAFNGALGNFQFSATASPTNLTVGDPITLRVLIKGKGTLDSLNMPAPDWREFKTYPPSSMVTNTDELGLAGIKTFEQVVIPQNAEVKALPPLAFSFFDPEQRTFRTLTQPAIPLSIRPGPAAPAQPTILAGPAQPQDAPPPAKDIVHIKSRPGLVAQIRPPLLVRPWFLALQGLPLALWLAAILWRKRQDKLAKDPRLRRRLRVEQVVRAGMRELTRLAAANQTEEFFAAVFRLLQEQLGERLDLPASAITEAVLDERLLGRGAPPELLSSLHDLFQVCNQVRYAPQRTSQELLALAPKVENALRQLQVLNARPESTTRV